MVEAAKSLKLKSNIGKDCYLAGSMPESNDAYPLFVGQFKIDLRNHLNDYEIDSADELIAIHGVVTSAVSIPLVIPEEVEIFLVVKDANMEFESYIIPANSLDDLQQIITCLTTLENIEEEDIPEDIVDYLSNLEQQEIEDLYVVYGLQVPMLYSVDQSSTPFTKVEGWKTIFSKIKERQL